MNSGLTRFIEFMKDYKIRKLGKPKYGIENLPVEYKLRSRDAEEVNYQKMLQNMAMEHSQLKKRLEVVGDPSYSLELRRKNMEIKQQIRALEEERRRLANEKFQRDKKIGRVMEAGQPDAMLEIQKKVQEMTIVFDKLERINKQLEFQEGTKLESQKKFEETQQRLQDLEAKAKAKNIDLDKLDEDESETGISLEQDPKTYERKEAIIKQAIETDKQMYMKVLGDLKTKLVSELKEKNEIVHKIRERHFQTNEKRKEVNELMVKSKLISEADVGKFDQENDESLKDLPEEELASEDTLISKLTTVIKSSKNKKKSKTKKKRTEALDKE